MLLVVVEALIMLVASKELLARSCGAAKAQGARRKARKLRLVIFIFVDTYRPKAI
jgi:hypothetical protein